MKGRWRDGVLVARVLLALDTAWLAFVLALPGDTFATSSGFRLMAEVMSEDRWAAVFAVAATIEVASLFSRRR